MVLTTKPPHVCPIAAVTEVYINGGQATDNRGEGQCTHTALMNKQSHTFLDSVQIR